MLSQRIQSVETIRSLFTSSSLQFGATVRHILVGGVLLATATGCFDSLEEQTKKSKNSIIGKTTQNIGKLQPGDAGKVSDSKINATDPITGPMSAYGPILEKASAIAVDQAINTFYALEGRYPKDHDEFMNRVILENNIKLPVLPFGATYQYDEANHKLVVLNGTAKTDGSPLPDAATNANEQAGDPK